MMRGAPRQSSRGAHRITLIHIDMYQHRMEMDMTNESNSTRLSMPYGHATVEVLESHPHPERGPIVERGPYGMAWCRREVFSVMWSARSQGYVVDFFVGGCGFYPERNVRNLIVCEPVDAGFNDGRSGRTSHAAQYDDAEQRKQYEFGFDRGRKSIASAAYLARCADGYMVRGARIVCDNTTTFGDAS